MMTPKTVQAETQVRSLTKALKETFRVYAATHVAHWNVRGPYFPALHTLYEEQYTELWKALDTIAERIRTYDESVDPSCFTLDEDVPSGADDAEGTVRRLARDNRALSDRWREIEKNATESGDPATADIAIGRIRAHDKAAWMLEAILE